MLLISESKTRANLQRMADRAQRHGLQLRPHAKTHQSLVVAEWFKDYGIQEISVTSLRMAKAMAPGSWKGITIATPLNPTKIPEINALAKTTPVTVFVTSLFSARKIQEHAGPGVRCLIELDAGYGRSGIPFQNEQLISDIKDVLGPERFQGFYVHSGHTYDATSQEAIFSIHQKLLAAVKEVRNRASTPPSAEFIIGDTPACSTQEDFSEINAIGPGNFVYYDLVQVGLGACRSSDVAVCFAAAVLEIQLERGQAILHAGWVQLGKDQLADGTYGRLVRLNDKGDGWGDPVPGAEMIKLSQEHGTAKIPEDWLTTLNPGDLVGILPVHSCATVHGALALAENRIVP